MGKLLFLLILLFSFTARAEEIITYYNSKNEQIIQPDGLTLIKENLYRDKENNLYIMADYIKHFASDNTTIVPKKLGIFLQNEIYDIKNGSLIPISKVIDIGSYQMLDASLFKDKYHVYFYTGTEYANYPFVIADELISPDDITLLEGNYLISNNHVYHYGRYSYIVEVKNAQASTFTVFRLRLKDEEMNRYIIIGKDTNRCYLEGEALDKDGIASIKQIVNLKQIVNSNALLDCN